MTSLICRGPNCWMSWVMLTNPISSESNLSDEVIGIRQIGWILNNINEHHFSLVNKTAIYNLLKVPFIQNLISYPPTGNKSLTYNIKYKVHKLWQAQGVGGSAKRERGGRMTCGRVGGGWKGRLRGWERDLREERSDTREGVLICPRPFPTITHYTPHPLRSAHTRSHIL